LDVCEILWVLGDFLRPRAIQPGLENMNKKKGIKYWGVDEVARAVQAVDPHYGLQVVVDDSAVVPVACEEAITPMSKVILPEHKYVLVGGLGGLGRSIADLLVANGARDIVFLSPNGANSTDRQDYLKSLRVKGARVEAIAVDCCDMDSLLKVLKSDIGLPGCARIAGVVQCAAVLKVSLPSNGRYLSPDLTAPRRIRCLITWITLNGLLRSNPRRLVR
jgi:hypothetical protein